MNKKSQRKKRKRKERKRAAGLQGTRFTKMVVDDSLVRDSQREVLGDDVDYFEFTDIDDVGCK